MARYSRRRSGSTGVRRKARRSSGSGYRRTGSTSRRSSRSSSRGMTHKLVIQVADQQPAITGADLAAGRVQVQAPKRTRAIF